MFRFLSFTVLMFYDKGREPMAREPDVALLITTSGSFDNGISLFC